MASFAVMFFLSCAEKSVKESEKNTNESKQQIDANRKPTVAEACDALLRDLHIRRDSQLGKRLVARDLNCDHNLGICSVSGYLDMNLNQLRFRVIILPPDPSDKRTNRDVPGKFYFGEDGRLGAKLLE